MRRSRRTCSLSLFLSLSHTHTHTRARAPHANAHPPRLLPRTHTQVHYLGPPAPPCENARVATMRALDKIGGVHDNDPEIASILRLTASMFQVGHSRGGRE